MKVLQVCNSACDNEPHQELIGKKATWFCCFKGFEKSLNDFLKAQSNKYNCHVCLDKKVYLNRSCPNCQPVSY